MNRGLLNFWLLSMLGLALFAVLFFVAFDYLVAPLRAGQTDLPVALRDDVPVASAKLLPYRIDGSLKGIVDGAILRDGKLHITGWVIDEDGSSTKLYVVAILDGHVVGVATPHVFRPDLLVPLNLKNGSVGFDGIFETPAAKREKGHSLRVMAVAAQPSIGVNELAFGPGIRLQDTEGKD